MPYYTKMPYFLELFLHECIFKAPDVFAFKTITATNLNQASLFSSSVCLRKDFIKTLIQNTGYKDNQSFSPIIFIIS